MCPTQIVQRGVSCAAKRADVSYNSEAPNPVEWLDDDKHVFGVEGLVHRGEGDTIHGLRGGGV